MNNNHKIRSIAIIIVIVLMVMAMPAMASTGVTQNQDKIVVRVGYFHMADYYDIDNRGLVGSYDKSYLDRIALNSNLVFEYVNCDSWSNALKMLEQGDIDLLGTAQKSDARMEKYEFCEESYGYSVAELATLPGREYIYEDYDAIGSSIIGCTKEYINLPKLKEYFEAHDIDPIIKYYNNVKELEEALGKGEVDIVAANSHSIYDSWVVLEKYYYSPFFFMSRKGNEELVKSIDEALIDLKLYDAQYNEQLIEKYFPLLVDSPFSKEEYDVINKKETYTLYLDPQVRPLSWYDQEDDSMKGLLVDIARQLAETTGLNIVVRPTGEYTQEDNSKIIYKTIYKNSSISETGLTDSIFTQDAYFYFLKGPSNNLSQQKIAIVKNRGDVDDYVRKRYPNSNIVEYDTPLDCLNALKESQVDMALLDSRVAAYLITKHNLDSIAQLPADPVELDISLQFFGDDATMLKSIINKGIKKIDYDKIEEKAIEDSLNEKPDLTLEYIMRTYPILSGTALVTILALIIIITWLCAYSGLMKKEKTHMEQVDKEKSELFASVSHDMRTPMNGIMGMIDLTKRSDNLDEVRENMDKAQEAGEYILRLINDILEMEKTNQDKDSMNCQIVNAKSYLKEIISTMEPLAKEKNVRLTVNNKDKESGIYIRVDTLKVQQLFTNLITNAIKYTPSEGHVNVDIEIMEREPHKDRLMVTITDNGVGMSEDFIKDDIFKPFMREKNRFSDQYTGTGLGLYIVKNIVEAMNGSIQVKSKLGEGTEFSFCLDIDTMGEDYDPSGSIMQSEKEQHNMQNMHILLCEDQALNAEIAQRMLEVEGCILDWAKNGQEGVRMFTQSEPGYYDVLLADIRMPIMDGIEMAKTIRSSKRADALTIPIIAMTANTQKEDIENILNAGMNAYLAKPINRKKLYDTIYQCTQEKN